MSYELKKTSLSTKILSPNQRIEEFIESSAAFIVTLVLAL